MEFVITKSFASAADVSVAYSSTDGSASSPDDYTPVEGNASLPGDIVSVIVSVPIVGDTQFEPDETFFINLSDAFASDIEDGQGIGTILNDDPAPPSPSPIPPPSPVPGPVAPSPEPPPSLTPTPTPPPTPSVSSPSPSPAPTQTPPVTPPPTAPPPEAPRPPGQTVAVSSPGGGQQGPPGGALNVSARGFGGCSNVLFMFDDVQIGSAAPNAAGAASVDGLSVPGNFDAGTHRVSARCEGPGFGVATTPFDVTTAAAHRTALVSSLPQPWQVSLDPAAIGFSVLAALIAIVLVALPAELFNSTLDANSDEIRAFLHLRPKSQVPIERINPAGTFTLFVFLGGILYALLSPDFGLNESSFALVVGMTIALAVTTAGFGLPQNIYMRRRFGERGRLAVVPGTLVVSAVFVILSLVVQLNPGLLYGIVAGFAFRRHLAEKEEGLLAAFATFFFLLVCLAAWFARSGVSAVAAEPDAGFFILTLEAALAGILLVGLESLAIGLIPLRVLNGRKIADWSFPAWMGVFVLTVAAFVHILLTPSSGYVSPLQGRSGIIFLILAGIMAAAAIAFWAYFQFRAPRGSKQF